MTLLDEIRTLWRFYSVRLAAVAGLLVAWLVADPTILLQLVDQVPDGWRPVASLAIGFVTFALPTLARRLPQP